ncbi:hypothetical protein ACIGXM_31205 [Kitasatospora sp. NPDC052896]|uniref:hypothetical protein n=1 Tax=Kitasatospora sp. NPDC052896 TaxID=3364061 RepID=UPI0037C6848A
MRTRTFTVTTAGLGAAVLAATGITYASTSGSTPASPSVRQAAPPVQQAAQPVEQAAPAAAAAAAPAGGSTSGEQSESRDHQDGGRGGEERNRDRDHGGGERGDRHRDVGRIYFNEREYAAAGEGCISAVSGLGSSSFSIFNDSRKTVEVFRGFTCDNGAPVATVGPYGDTNGVVTSTVHGGLLFGDDGVVGSFRVIGDYDEW